MDASVLSGYDPSAFYCEMLSSPANAPVRERLAALSVQALKQRAAAAEAELYNLGITFTVYSEKDAIDRILPFDVIPRIIPAGEWAHIERGVIQRITAINLLLDDLYHRQLILARRRAAARPGAGQPELLQADAGRGPAAPDLCPCQRHRPRARRARHLPGARGQCPHPLRGQLRHREPAPDAARLPRPAGRGGAAPGGELRPEACRGAARGGSARPRCAADRAALPRRLQFRLLRARVPGARDGRAAGRGTRPGGGGRPRLDAHHRRAGAGGRDLPPDQRRLPGPGGVPEG